MGAQTSLAIRGSCIDGKRNGSAMQAFRQKLSRKRESPFLPSGLNQAVPSQVMDALPNTVGV